MEEEGEGDLAETVSTTKAPKRMVTIAVKFTRNASVPYLSSPPLSKKVSFSRKP